MKPALDGSPMVLSEAANWMGNASDESREFKGAI